MKQILFYLRHKSWLLTYLISYFRSHDVLGIFYEHKLTLNSSWVSNHMPSKYVWDEITFPFPIFSGSTVEVWEWISNFISRFIMDVID